VQVGVIASSVSKPAKPFSLVAKGTLCSAERFSSCTHEGQPVVKPQVAPPAAMILRAASASSGQVCGGALGSRPAFCKAVLL
jgi:hypothetical protein